MSFYLVPGNKLETLAKCFCETIYCADSAGDPLKYETVVVQTQGMASFLRQYIAGFCGAAVNLDMPFPNGFMERVLSANVPDFAGAKNFFSQEYMAWEIFQILEENKSQGFPELRSFITGRDCALRQWQLSERVAALFDRYQIYRYQDKYFPLKDEQWQSRLWRELKKRYGRSKMDCCREFLSGTGKINGVPERVTVFGVGSLPPLYLDIFFKIAETAEVYFFYLTPCRDFWEDLCSERERRRLGIDCSETAEGNPLLASWGESGRELLTNLLTRQDSVPYFSTEENFYEDYLTGGDDDTLLKQLQQDILTMNDARSGTVPAKDIFADDDSVGIFNCYAPKREVEVLHDKLIALLRDKKVQLRDIIVMAPDINEYYPYIESVFSGGPLRDCYTVADRNLHAGCAIGDVFRRLLKLPSSRMTFQEVMQLISVPAVSCAFGIRDEDIPQISRYMSDAGVRWGSDAADHKRFCDVAFDEYSWDNAVNRIFTLFARGPLKVEEQFDDLPVLKENDMVMFGRFCRFLQMLRQLQKSLMEKRTLRQWMEFLEQQLNIFFKSEEPSVRDEIGGLRNFFSSHRMTAEGLKLDAEFPVGVIAELLESFLGQTRDRFSFLRGKITFCSLTPLRSIPAGAIAILGLDDRAFPRRDMELGFDLMNKVLLPGDRSAAREDRYLFLEALMSARKYFWCFYNGRSRKDGKKLPPSPVLGELMDYLYQAYGVSEVLHHIHGFAKEYFYCGSKLFSFSAENFRTAKLLDGTREHRKPGWRDGAFDISGTVPEKTSLEELIKWARHPAEFLLRSRFNVRFAIPEGSTDRESPQLSAFDGKYMVDRNIAYLDNHDFSGEESFHALQRNNMLPPGEAGRAAFKKELELMRKIPAAWRQEYYAQNRMALAFESSGFSVPGTYEASPALDRQKILVFSSLKHKFLVNAIMRHHGLCMISDAATVETSIMTLEKEQWVEKRWSSPGKGRACSQFWKYFFRLWCAGFSRIPALFPSTMFAVAEQKHDSMEALVSSTMKKFAEEIASDAALERCFTDDAPADTGVMNEFCSFMKLFYSDSSQWEDE